MYDGRGRVQRRQHIRDSRRNRPRRVETDRFDDYGRSFVPLEENRAVGKQIAWQEHGPPVYERLSKVGRRRRGKQR